MSGVAFMADALIDQHSMWDTGSKISSCYLALCDFGLLALLRVGKPGSYCHEFKKYLRLI
jgi:hypothetical protein